MDVLLILDFCVNLILVSALTKQSSFLLIFNCNSLMIQSPMLKKTINMGEIHRELYLFGTSYIYGSQSNVFSLTSPRVDLNLHAPSATCNITTKCI